MVGLEKILECIFYLRKYFGKIIYLISRSLIPYFIDCHPIGILKRPPAPNWFVTGSLLKFDLNATERNLESLMRSREVWSYID